MTFKNFAEEAKKNAPIRRIGMPGSAPTPVRTGDAANKGSVIKGIIEEKEDLQGAIPTTWKECKHMKPVGEKTVCTEYFTNCGKESCRRARK